LADNFVTKNKKVIGHQKFADTEVLNIVL